MRTVWYAVVALAVLIIIVYFMTNSRSGLSIPSVGGCSTCSGSNDNNNETFSNDFTGMNDQMVYTTTGIGMPP